MAHWTLARRLCFRFICVYFLLYCFPGSGRISVIGVIPGAGNLLVAPWHAICPWIGSHWFHLSGTAITYVRTGSGDTTLEYIQNLLMLLIALLAAIVWSILDRKRANYEKLEPWLRLLVRYTLAFTLFGYGFAKVFPLQFRAPGFAKLLEPWGEFSPMGALWSFMGASTAYIIFSGAAEILPGLLLIFRRTTTLGALIAMAVLLNVTVLNYCYDVPVKLYSTNLLLMAIYLAAADIRRLINVLVLNRPTEPVDHSAPMFPRRWARITALVFQIVLVGFTLGNSLYGGWTGYQSARVNPARPPIYGLYKVTRFTRNGEDVPPLMTDSNRWRTVIAEFPGFITIKMMNDKVRGYPVTYNDDRKLLTLTEGSQKFTLTYSQTSPDQLTLEGNMGSDHLSVLLKKTDPTQFLLLNRGFHWINEQPFNR